MLPAHLRLPAKEIPQIAKRGKLFQHEMLHIRLWYDDKLNSPKCAITISTKVHKNATVRNRIKRKLRVGIIELNSSGKLLPGKYLFIVKSTELASADPALIISQCLKNPAFKQTVRRLG
jgi:ribonuclease P protein component